MPYLTLDTIIEQNGLTRLDYLNIMVNGAEGEVLNGCKRHASSLQNLRIASRYQIGGEAVRPKLRDWLLSNGLNITNENEFTIYASTAIPQDAPGD